MEYLCLEIVSSVPSLLLRVSIVFLLAFISSVKSSRRLVFGELRNVAVTSPSFDGLASTTQCLYVIRSGVVLSKSRWMKVEEVGVSNPEIRSVLSGVHACCAYLVLTMESVPWIHT